MMRNLSKFSPFILIIILGSFVFLVALRPAAAKAEPFTVDDLLAMESFGHAVIDPTGRWLLFEKIRRYDQINDYSYRAYAQQFSGQQIWRVDLENIGEPEMLSGLYSEPSSYIESFSGDGSFLAFYQYDSGALKLGVYNMHTDEARVFDRAPEYQRTGRHRPAWVSEHEIIFSAVPRGEQPRMPTFRTEAARLLSGAWRGAFTGDQVTAQVFRTGDNRTLQPAMLDGDLVLVNALTGDLRYLAPGRFSDIQASPSRSHVAALAESEVINAEADLRSPGFERLHLLTIVDLTAGTSWSPAPDLEFLPGTIAWDASGRYLTAFGWPLGERFRSGHFQIIDLYAGSVRPARHNQLELSFRNDIIGFYIPQRPAMIGGDVVVFASLRDSDVTQRYAGAETTDATERHWFLIREDGSFLQLSAGLRDVSGELVYNGGDFITVLAAGGLYRINGEGQQIHLTPTLQGTPRAVPLSPYGQVLDTLGFDRNASEILLRSSSTGVSGLFLTTRTGGEEGSDGFHLPVGEQESPIAASLNARLIVSEVVNEAVSTLRANTSTRTDVLEIAHVNEHLQSTHFGSWYAFEYPLSEGGELVRSCILLPTAYNADMPPPLIVEVYPNSRPSCESRTPYSPYPFAMSPDLWAGRGFAYARLATPPEHIRQVEGPIAGLPQVIDAGTREILERGWADPQQVVLFGTSQGGVSALYVAAHSNLYAATIATHSWADLFAHYFEGAGMYSYAHGEAMAGNAIRYESDLGSDFSMGHNPFDNPEIYYANSPVYLAPQIQTSVFLMSTDMDIFSMSQFDKMYGALLRSGGNAVYIRYLGEGHTLSSPANIRDLWERIDSFLEESLEQ